MLTPGSSPRYDDESGHLLFARSGSLWAAPFDADRLELTGEAFPIVETIDENSFGFAAFDVQRGTLAYLDRAAVDEQILVWVERDGGEEALSAPMRAYRYPRVSPDGQQVAVSVTGEAPGVWIWSLKGERLTPVTTGPAVNLYNIWTRDGRQIFFGSDRGDGFGLYRKATDGAGETERLARADRPVYPTGMSPDGKSLVYRIGDFAPWHIGLLSLDGESEPTPLLESTYNEFHADISPDGRWLAYTSDESGQREVYVCHFPEVDSGRWQVSNDGGEAPVWSPSGDELFYRFRKSGVEARMMAVRVIEAGEVRPGRPEVLFAGDHLFGEIARNYDVSPDGERFLMIRAAPGTSSAIVVVENWFEELKRLAPAS